MLSVTSVLLRIWPPCFRMVLVSGLCLTTGLTAATLTVKDEVGEVAVEIESDNSVAFLVGSNGDVTLTLNGYYVAISDNPSTAHADSDEDADADDSADADVSELDPSHFCVDNDDDLAECRWAEANDFFFDPWISSVGEKGIWIQDKKTEVFPFTLPARSDAAAAEVRYGYLQLTTPERQRVLKAEDVFHMWWSETSNGTPLESANCEV